MSVNDTVKAGVEAAFAAAEDFVILGTYTVRTGTPTYDPATDVYSVATTAYTPVRMLPTTLQEQEMEASPVTVGDSKILIPASDLPAVVPSETDLILMGGVSYNVIRIKAVPGGSLWIIFAREK